MKYGEMESVPIEIRAEFCLRKGTYEHSNLDTACLKLKV